MEVFVFDPPDAFVSVFYQQSLQLAVSFMQVLHEDPDGLLDDNLRTNLKEFLQVSPPSLTFFLMNYTHNPEFIQIILYLLLSLML